MILLHKITHVADAPEAERAGRRTTPIIQYTVASAEVNTDLPQSAERPG